jgi:RecA/RadA recombinase
MKTEEVRRRLKKRKQEKVLSHKDFLSTGSTLLNLACTDHPEHGFAKGHYYLIVGTSRSGKTWLSLSCLAEAACNPSFKHHRFIYDNVERGALMDIGRFFGQAVAKRLKTVHSRYIEGFYYRLDSLIEKGRPFIYILDSMDSLTSKLEGQTFQKQKQAHLKDREVAGSYGDGKAKINSQCLRQVINPLEEAGSILIVINQTRDKLTGFGGKTRSGGNALQFYATLEIWSDIKKTLTKTYRKKERSQGVLCLLRVRKNRVTGKISGSSQDRGVEIPIYTTYGMDDVGSCIDYLASEKHWKRSKKGIIDAPEFDFKGKREKLIKLICDKNMEKDLAMLASDLWKEIEDAVAIDRKARYE